MPDIPMSDEMLMAYADGELDAATAGAVARAASADPIIEARIAAFRASREAARDAFADVLSEAPPARLVAALDAATERKVIAWPGRLRLPAAALPLAAGFAVAAVMAIVLAGRPDAPGGPVERIVAERLPALMSGSEAVVTTDAGDATLRVVGAYRSGARLCRTFALTSDAGIARGIGCGGDAGWTVEAMLAGAAPGGAFTTASDEIAAEIDAVLDRLDAEGPLDPAEEAALADAGD